MTKAAFVRFSAVFACSMLSALALSPFQTHGLTDSFFLVGMLELCVASFLIVLNGGFFNRFARAFRKLNRIRTDWSQTEEPKDPDVIRARIQSRKNWSVMLAISGLVLILFSLLFLPG
ncbi:DUF3899 domain-containing protein [Staphylospora marina]|uniref:DUF3899 domain-containing protein n=1 Tax=Staphylospora marina TaxID=2490858 RepID=UPI000F5C20E1|nr:DUF3899 domain-containing protein [Staphylospora marina]